MVLDLERGISGQIEPLPFQTDTCIGNWHYDAALYNRHGYKSAGQVVHMLLDIVSKNGNLMLNIPLKGNGLPDDDELNFLAKLTDWMKINSEGIYGTRPWYIFGEGPSSAPTGRPKGFNEKTQKYKPEDMRFAQLGETLFVSSFGWSPTGTMTVQSLGAGSPAKGAVVKRVELLGSGPVNFVQNDSGLVVTLPEKQPCDYAYTLKIDGGGLTKSS